MGDDARLEVIVLETGVCLYYGTLVTVVSIIYGMSVWVSCAAITFPAYFLTSDMTYICSLVGILKFLRPKPCESKFYSQLPIFDDS